MHMQLHFASYTLTKEKNLLFDYPKMGDPQIRRKGRQMAGPKISKNWTRQKSRSIFHVLMMRLTIEYTMMTDNGVRFHLKWKRSVGEVQNQR